MFGAGEEAAAFSMALIVLMILGSVWSIVWKGIALWQAARRDQLGWYIALLIINTLGILEIIYIFAVAPRQPELGQQSGPGSP
jgi:hypothetical protein